MPKQTPKQPQGTATESEVDQALKGTFPASDPVSLHFDDDGIDADKSSTGAGKQQPVRPGTSQQISKNEEAKPGAGTCGMKRPGEAQTDCGCGGR